MKFTSKRKLFIHDNAFGNVVCEMAAILSRADESINSGKSAFIGSQIVLTYIHWYIFANTVMKKKMS